MPKILILIHKLQHYRVPIFNLLSEKVDLTVACDNRNQLHASEIKFNIIDLKILNIGPFIIHKTFSLHDLCKPYDHVMALFNIRCLDVFYLLYRKRNYTITLWGIGVSASYEKKYDSKNFITKIKDRLALKADSLLFYTDYPIKRFKKLGFSEKKLFVANNTVSNLVSYSSNNRSYFIFIGSLYKKKGVMELICQYEKAYKIVGEEFNELHVIGDGDLYNDLENYISENNLKSKIKLYGAIYDGCVINSVMEKSLLCFSPFQAGLSVLHSMSCGVAFVTCKDAITGGEIFNINNWHNGVLLDDLSQVSLVMLDAFYCDNKYLRMGANAHKHYVTKRSPEMMSNAILDSVLRTV